MLEECCLSRVSDILSLQQQVKPVPVYDEKCKLLMNRINALPKGSEKCLHNEETKSDIHLAKLARHLRTHYLPMQHFNYCLALRGTLGENISAYSVSDKACVVMWKKTDKIKQVSVAMLSSLLSPGSSFDPRAWSILVFWDETKHSRTPGVLPTPSSTLPLDDPSVPHNPVPPSTFPMTADGDSPVEPPTRTATEQSLPPLEPIVPMDESEPMENEELPVGHPDDLVFAPPTSNSGAAPLGPPVNPYTIPSHPYPSPWPPQPPPGLPTPRRGREPIREPRERSRSHDDRQPDRTEPRERSKSRDDDQRVRERSKSRDDVQPARERSKSRDDPQPRERSRSRDDEQPRPRERSRSRDDEQPRSRERSRSHDDEPPRPRERSRSRDDPQPDREPEHFDLRRDSDSEEQDEDDRLKRKRADTETPPSGPEPKASPNQLRKLPKSQKPVRKKKKKNIQDGDDSEEQDPTASSS